LEDKRFAVLIDADNVSAKYIKYILDETANYGIATYKTDIRGLDQTGSSCLEGCIARKFSDPGSAI